ncbi:MAG: metallophosphoesterase family protein [Myxococcales bacterium]|nr:metallophosphoesterase family protein [Myxococcales bacterium]
MPRAIRRRSALRLGLLSDVHAHLEALERALDILERAGVDKLVCLGDVVEKGPEPDRVVERLDALRVITVQGNHDANAVRHAQLSSDARGMSRDTLAWLDALPRVREYAWAGKFVVLAHASLIDQSSAVRQGDVPKRMRRALRRHDPDVVVLGHTHVPMRFRYAHHWLCNPGSISHGRCSLGETCAVLTLPSASLEVYSLRTGERAASWRE